MIPREPELLNLLIRIELDKVVLMRTPISSSTSACTFANIRYKSGETYNRKGHDAIGEEVVVEVGKVRSSITEKVNGRFDLNGQCRVTLDGEEDLLLSFLQSRRRELLDDLGWVMD